MDFYRLRDYLKEVKSQVTNKDMSLFDLIHIFIPMVISILSIISWIYGVIQPQRATANT